MKMSDNKIWCEKYRPRKLKDLVGNQSIIDALLTYSELGRIPNLLMTGSSGCGKTSAVQSLANEAVLPDGEFLELNTSDERGIDTIRNKLKLFVGKKIPENRNRLVFLDEADGMTNQAQLGLKALMDAYSGKVTFVLSCNDATCLHECILSRCITLQFEPIPIDSMCKKMREIARTENINLCDDRIRAIADSVPGDLRSAINALQSLSLDNRESATTQASGPRSLVAGLLDLRRDCSGDELSMASSYRKAVKDSLLASSRCEDQYGIDKVCDIVESENPPMDPEVIRGVVELLLLGRGPRSTDHSDPILSVTRLLSTFRDV